VKKRALPSRDQRSGVSTEWSQASVSTDQLPPRRSSAACDGIVCLRPICAAANAIRRPSGE
jgi:hypothetical protein